MKAHASAGDRVQIRSFRHEIKTTAHTIRKRFGLITEFLGVTAVEEGVQFHFRPRPACQTADSPSDPPECCSVVMHAGRAHGDPERKPVRANLIASEPAQISRLDQGEPFPPTLGPTPQPILQRAEPALDAGETCCAARLCPPPVVEHYRLVGFSPWRRRQIIGLLFDRTRQEPQVGLGCFVESFDASRRIVKTIMFGRSWRSHMCKICFFCSLSEGLFGMTPQTLCSARDGLRGISDRALAQETKGVPLGRATERTFASV
jgi:hypothetical protein